MFKISYCNQMSIVQGDTATFTIEVDNYIFSEGDKAYFTVRKDTKESPIAIQKIITEFDEHHFTVYLDKKATNIPVGDYLYDIQLNLADGRVDTIILPTKFSVLGGVTLD